MIRFFRALPLHFKSAFKSIGRRFGSAVSSMFAVTITLILMSLFVTVAFNVDSFTKSIENSIRIFARIDLVVPDEQHIQIEDQIKAIPGIAKVQYSSRDEQFDIFVNSDIGGEAYESLRGKHQLQAAYYIDVTDPSQMESVSAQIRQIEGIHDVDFGGDDATGLIDAFNSIRLGGSIFVGALCILAMFLISNTINMNINARKDEIGIMRQVGASNAFIKIPFLLEGIILGALGSILPIVLTIFGYQYLFGYMGGQLFSPMFKMIEIYPFVTYVSLGLLGVGMLVGFIGSLVSVNKSLRWKR